MAEPTITFQIYSSGWQTWGSGDTLKFCGSGGISDPVTVPASGEFKVADKMILDASTDYECTQYEGGGNTGAKGSGTPLSAISNDDYIQILVSTNPETAAGELTLWDDTNYNTTNNEILTDSDWSNYCWIRMAETGSNVTGTNAPDNAGVPSGYKSQTDSTTTYQYKGSTKLTFSSACAAGKGNRIVMHCFVPDNAGAGTSGHTCVLTYTYYYT